MHPEFYRSVWTNVKHMRAYENVNKTYANLQTHGFQLNMFVICPCLRVQKLFHSYKTHCNADTHIQRHSCLFILKYLIYIDTLFTYTISQEHFFNLPLKHTDLDYDL